MSEEKSVSNPDSAKDSARIIQKPLRLPANVFENLDAMRQSSETDNALFWRELLRV